MRDLEFFFEKFPPEAIVRFEERYVDRDSNKGLDTLTIKINPTYFTPNLKKEIDQLKTRYDHLVKEEGTSAQEKTYYFHLNPKILATISAQTPVAPVSVSPVDVNPPKVPPPAPPVQQPKPVVVPSVQVVHPPVNPATPATGPGHISPQPKPVVVVQPKKPDAIKPPQQPQPVIDEEKLRIEEARRQAEAKLRIEEARKQAEKSFNKNISSFVSGYNPGHFSTKKQTRYAEKELLKIITDITLPPGLEYSHVIKLEIQERVLTAISNDLQRERRFWDTQSDMAKKVQEMLNKVKNEVKNEKKQFENMSDSDKTKVTDQVTYQVTLYLLEKRKLNGSGDEMIKKRYADIMIKANENNILTSGPPPG